MFQALIVWVQQEVLVAVRDVMIGQELQIILIKLKLQRMLLQNLQRHEKETKSECDGWIVSSCCGFTSLQCINDQRMSPVLLKGQRSVISSPPDTIQTEPTGPHCSHPAVFGGQRERSVEYLRPPGSIGKNNSCFGDEALLFSALVRIPSLPLPPCLQLSRPQDRPPNCLSCQLQFQKTNAETMCWCKCMGVGLCDPGDTKKLTQKPLKLAFQSWHSSHHTHLIFLTFAIEQS